jgi:hypothetical protein
VPVPAALDGLAVPVPVPVVPPLGVAVPEGEVVALGVVVGGVGGVGVLSSELAEPAALELLAGAPVPAGLLPRVVVSMPPMMFGSDSERVGEGVVAARGVIWERSGRLAIVPAGPVLGSVLWLGVWPVVVAVLLLAVLVRSTGATAVPPGLFMVPLPVAVTPVSRSVAPVPTRRSSVRFAQAESREAEIASVASSVNRMTATLR